MFVLEPKHLHVEPNIYAPVEAKCLFVEETHALFAYVKGNVFRLLKQNIHALHDEKHCITVEAKYYSAAVRH